MSTHASSLISPFGRASHINSAIACSLGSLGYRVRLLTITDTTWFGPSVYLFSQAEMSAGIICSCMPILAALFRTTTPRKFHFSSLFPSSWFQSRGSHGSRRPFALGKSASADRLHRDKSTDQDSKNNMELEHGTGFVQPKNAIMVTRGVEIF